MNRYTFLLKSLETDSIANIMLPIRDQFENLTVWEIGTYIFAHFEGTIQEKNHMLAELDKLPEQVECLYLPGQMAMMYENRGCVISKKNALSYRVFAARLKPGCADEYKRRHSLIPPLPNDRENYESNWGIWLGDGCVFGYCELNPSLRQEPTEDEIRETLEWETKQLEIIEWMTNDMDWLTGEKHLAVKRVL